MTQEGEHAGLSLLNHLLLLRANVGSFPPAECFRDDRLQECVHLVDPFHAWILDHGQARSIVDRHSVRLIFVRLHAVCQHVDNNLTLIIHGHLDVILNAGGHGEIVRRNLANCLQELLSSSGGHFAIFDRGFQAVLKGSPRIRLDHLAVVFAAILHAAIEQGCWALWFGWLFFLLFLFFVLFSMLVSVRVDRDKLRVFIVFTLSLFQQFSLVFWLLVVIIGPLVAAEQALDVDAEVM